MACLIYVICICFRTTASTTYIVISNLVHCEAYSIQHYVIKSVSDLRQVGGFLRVLRCPLLMKAIRPHDVTEILLKVALKP
jgi:hypothetical protein